MLRTIAQLSTAQTNRHATVTDAACCVL